MPAAQPDLTAALSHLPEGEQLALAMISPAVHFATCVTIKDRNNQPLQNPPPNVLQRRMSTAFETLMERGVGKIRMIVVKPRQVGCSTFAQHIMYHFGQRRAVEGIVISDVKEHSEELLQKLKSYGHSDRFPWGRRMGGTKRTVTWDHGTNWTVDSAENPDAGVGGTRQAAHFSEVAKWPATAVKNAERTMAAVLPSLGGSPSVVIAESTPEGAFGWFFDTYAAALRLEELLALLDSSCAPEEVWVKVFAAWWEFPEHRRGKAVSAGEIGRIRETLSPSEEQGIERHAWDWEQIAWRRDTIDAKCNGSEKIFDCYYPEDDVSCWAASGAPRFEMSVLMDMDARARQAMSETGWLVAQETGGVAFSPQRDGKGELQVWERPREGMRYVIACDPATGESQTIGADPDRTSIQVWRARYFDTGLDRAIPARLVARIRPPFTGDDDVAAGHVTRLSQWYGHALVALEVNQGLQVLRLLKDAGVPLYKRVVESARTKSREEQYGFKLTDDNQRRMVIEGLAAAIRNREVEVLCRDWIHEAMVFITKSNGRSEAAPGEHDDDVMAAAMAWEVLPSAGEFCMRRARGTEPGDRGNGGWERVSAWK
ncbi:hypothetical protein [Haloferula sp. BvORR071]|uniref:hypothetical protein n=1 Tax=Haloferula sp. BvORR071 TaxID=1396141 RepID=UPI0005506514|nr:hypothetical protein [Haloferula sp. BvORR071]